MSKKENLQMQETLRSTINGLLCEKGLEGTSYQAVADEAGISRALVQYYYPRKIDFAVEYLNTLLSTIAKMLGVIEYEMQEQLSYEDAYRIGCYYYGYLFSDDGGRRLLYDILKDRESAAEMMRGHYEWALERVDPTRPKFEERSQHVIEVWGGFYELMYCSIKQDFEIDIPSKTLLIMKAFLGDEADLSNVRSKLSDLGDAENFYEALKAQLAQSKAIDGQQGAPYHARA